MVVRGKVVCRVTGQTAVYLQGRLNNSIASCVVIGQQLYDGGPRLHRVALLD